MNRDNNDTFLSSLDKMFNQTKEKGSVTITIKRFVKPEKGNYQRKKKEMIKLLREKSLEDQSLRFPLILHAKTDDSKTSTEVEPTKAGAFENSLLNVYRLRCFKTVAASSKKIKKPTPRDPNSKRSKKLEERKKLKKLRNLKKKEKQIQRHLATKTGGNKMEIESSK